VTKFLTLLISGLSLGAIYALIALGFVILFKASEVVNFAHGSLLLVGTFILARNFDGLSFYGAVAVAVAGTALVGLVIERGLVTPLRRAPVVSLAIMTIGVDIVIATVLTRWMGTDLPLATGQPWGGQVISFGDVTITKNRLIAVVVAAVLIVAFFVAFKYSNWGVAMRASAEDGEAAALMGIRLGRVTAVAWLVAGALAAIAGIFLTGAPTPGLDPSARAVALRAFPAAILGGLDSTGGALVGGLVIGVAESMTGGYQDQLTFLGRGIGDVVPYIVMIAVLLVRPSGLFGTRELARV
jgi:branched-chain amino acid transport system permease protein